MLAFLDDDELKALAKKIAASPDGVYQEISMENLLPFLEDEDVDELMLAAYRRGDSPAACYPFASDGGLSKLLKLVLDSDDEEFNLLRLLPFLTDENLAMIAQIIISKGHSFGKISLEHLLPFMDDDAIDQVFLLKVKNHDPFAKKIAPFVSDGCFHELVKDYASGKMNEIDWDAYYPYLDDADLHLLFQTELARR
ncbi:MAG: hypothetical protein M0P35_11210 [Bacteroidales bacterium]|nr:hypothetical protein [Bacteroidales bacterium]